MYYAGAAPENVVKISREMAEQVDVPYMVKSNVASGGSYNYAASQGIPSILIERGGMVTGIMRRSVRLEEMSGIFCVTWESIRD